MLLCNLALKVSWSWNFTALCVAVAVGSTQKSF